MENPFRYVGETLHCDGVPLNDIAGAAGTPCYVYSAPGILARYHAYDESFDGLPHQVCYAVKANSNLGVLKMLAEAGAGFDIVSGGELFRVLRAGGDPEKVIFSGVGKTESEIEYALSSGIHSFNCESDAELELLNAVALRLGTRARVAIRVNPDVDAQTHPYISTGLRDHKFGIDLDEAEKVYGRAMSLAGILVEGVSCHIGSQLLDPAPVIEAVGKLAALASTLRTRGVPLKHLDLGGGLGVAYEPSQQTPGIRDFIRHLSSLVSESQLKLMVEPGRSIVAECGALLTRVLSRKRSAQKEFVIIDAAMNDLIRPALYKAHHQILPVRQTEGDDFVVDVVGPVCETGDFLARNRRLPAMGEGDLLAVMTAGAYGFVLSSNYNSRPRAAEVIVNGDTWHVARRRESLDDLIRGE